MPAMNSSACLERVPDGLVRPGRHGGPDQQLGVLAALAGVLGGIARLARLRALAAAVGLGQPLFMRHLGEADATDRSARAPRA